MNLKDTSKFIALIRANQGHSIPVDVELKEKMPPDILWHGTGEKYTDSIEMQGLKPKSRLYVHEKAKSYRLGQQQVAFHNPDLYLLYG